MEGKFFWPENTSADPSAAAKNDDSLVLRLRYQERTILLPGDAEKGAEREMLSESGQNELRAEALKIGHHGSKNSTTAEFLAAVKPRLAIISVGEDNRPSECGTAGAAGERRRSRSANRPRWRGAYSDGW